MKRLKIHWGKTPTFHFVHLLTHMQTTVCPSFSPVAVEHPQDQRVSEVEKPSLFLLPTALLVLFLLYIKLTQAFKQT